MEKDNLLQKEYSFKGLSLDEVERSRMQYGPNVFVSKKVNGWVVFIKQFMNALTAILLVSSIFSFIMGEFADGSIILFIVIMNAILSFVQEYRSSKAVENLSQLIKKHAVVVRNGIQHYIDVKEIVPGDLVILRGGDIVPADIEIYYSNHVEVNESQLTGESELVIKKAGSTKKRNMTLFSGSLVEKGYCRGIVTATGYNTELGKIATLTKDARKVSPYQKSLADFSTSVLKIIGSTLIVMVVAKIAFFGANDLFDLVFFTIALAMSVIPEALPMITTINFSYGAIQLAKQNVVVKHIPSVEDLGKIDVLCTDKTGTLTQNKISIVDVVTTDQSWIETLAFVSLDSISTAASNAMDQAFRNYVSNTTKTNSEQWQQLEVIPFEPDVRRRRAVIKNTQTQKSYLVVVGAVETLLHLSNKTDTDWLNNVKSDRKGIRQVAIAYKEILYHPGFNILQEEKELQFLGIAKMTDTLCKTTKQAIAQTKQLGIATKILTGDSYEAASYVGEEIGLIDNDKQIYIGSDLENMDAESFHEAIIKGRVFARVTPIMKYKILETLKKEYVVGFMGDGINDTPAMNLADISIAVNNATDIAKESADIVLMEDNLLNIIHGIQYGRSIFVNINKYIKHAMIGNLGNFFSLSLFYVAFAMDLPMLPIQLLLANLIQDMPLMTIYSDSVDPIDLATPKQNTELRKVLKSAVYLGIFTMIYYLLYFFYMGTDANEVTRTNLFLFFNITQLLVIISIRNKQFLWQGKKPAPLLLGTIAFFVIFSIAIPYTPVVSTMLGFTPLPLLTLGKVGIIAIVYILLLDVCKIAIGKWERRKEV